MDLLALFLLSTALSPVLSSSVNTAHKAQNEQLRLAMSATAGGSPVNYGTSSAPTPAPVAPLSAGIGEHMKPVLGRREALNIGPDSSPLDTAVQPFPNKGCTTTLSTTYGYPCSWDGTTTMYPSTTVLFEQINCNGCDNVYVYETFYYCPNQHINATLKTGIPATSWSTICRPSAALAQRSGTDIPATTTALDLKTPSSVPNFRTGNPFPTPSIEPGPRLARSPDNGIQPAACPTTLVVQPVRSAGKTSTSYASFTTTTVDLNCGGCPLVVSTALAGYGPPGAFETTTTLPVGTVTTYACR